MILLYSRHYVLADNSDIIMEDTLKVPFPLHQLLPEYPNVHIDGQHGRGLGSIRHGRLGESLYHPYNEYPYELNNDDCESHISPVAFYIIIGLTLLLSIVNVILLALLVFKPKRQANNREVRVRCMDEGCNLMPMNRREYCHQSPRNYTVECNCAVTTERVHDDSDTSVAS